MLRARTAHAGQGVQIRTQCAAASPFSIRYVMFASPRDQYEVPAVAVAYVVCRVTRSLSHRGRGAIVRPEGITEERGWQLFLVVAKMNKIGNATAMTGLEQNSR